VENDHERAGTVLFVRSCDWFGRVDRDWSGRESGVLVKYYRGEARLYKDM